MQARRSVIVASVLLVIGLASVAVVAQTLGSDPPILVPNCGTGSSSLAANVSQVIPGSARTILFSCESGNPALTVRRGGTVEPQFSLPLGYTSLKISTDSSCTSGATLISGSPVTFGSGTGTLPIGDYDYCASYSNAPSSGLQSFTITWSEAAVSVSIDIKPGSFPNSINPRSSGKIPVAILSSATVDAPRLVDRSSLTFGRTGEEHSLVFCSSGPEDANGDGLQDLVCHFDTKKTGFSFGDTVGILRGHLLDGTVIDGRDSVRIVPPRVGTWRTPGI